MPRQTFERHRRQLHQSSLEVLLESDREDGAGLAWLASSYGIHHIRIFGFQLSGKRHRRATAQYHPRLTGQGVRGCTPLSGVRSLLWSSGLTA
jgi:hypothetical protein